MVSFSAYIARNVRAERHRHRWTQKDLAEQIGWSTNMVQELETGKRHVGADDLPLLCRGLRITLAKLADGSDPADIEALGI